MFAMCNYEGFYPRVLHLNNFFTCAQVLRLFHVECSVNKHWLTCLKSSFFKSNFVHSESRDKFYQCAPLPYTHNKD